MKSHSNENQCLSNSSYQDDVSRSGREIAIIGMSGRFPGGANSPEKLWELLLSGRDGVGEAKGDRWDLGWHHPDHDREERVYTKAGGFLDRIDTFDADFFGISPKEARQVDPQHRLLLELAWEAMEDANLAPRQQAGTDVGVFIGISGNEYAHLVGPQGPDAYSNTGSAQSIAANRISYMFDFHGPSVAVDTACSSSLVCVHQACVSLLSDECTSALAGGVNLLIHVRPWIGFSRASMLSPTGRCKSFDASGDGYVRSEGGGLVLLKKLTDAERDGDRILGVILASGVNSDGRTLGLSMPNGDAQERLLRKVYGQCNLSPEDVFYVEAHGTGTSVGDPIECGALGRVLGAPRGDDSRCRIGSVKSNIGHLEAASGIAGLTKAVLSLQHRLIPGNLHFIQPNPKIDFENLKLDVVTELTPIPEMEQPISIGINSFGFGGTNAHLVLQEYRPHVTQSQKNALKNDEHRVMLLSGHNPAALDSVVRDYVELLSSSSETNWEDICAATATCRTIQKQRLAVAADSAEYAVEQLERYLANKATARLAVASTTSSNVPLVFVYSGNGPQWWGMGRELLAEDRSFREEIERIDKIFQPLSGWSLIAEMQRPESESRVALTEFAQPLLFALQLGLTRSLRDAGAMPAAVVGHSVGEVAAAYISGALSLEDATKVIYHRSAAQSKTAGLGKMAALGVSAAYARDVVKEVDGWLEIAAENAPDSITVAGDPKALEEIIRILTERGKFAKLLQLNYPFHTKAMDSIRGELVDALYDIKPGPTKVPFISTVYGSKVAGEKLNAEYWFSNIRERVNFCSAIKDLLSNRYAGVFLEVGPHPVLKEYVQQTAKTEGHSVVALQTLRRPTLRGPEPEVDHLWTAICSCHANGAINTPMLFQRPIPAPALPKYPWQRVEHWRGNVILPDVHQPTHRDHPLLGYQLTTAEGIWESTLDLNRLSYLKDHVVQRTVVFPAAGYLEVAFAAAEKLLGEGELIIEDLDILRPLAIPEHSDPLIQFAADTPTGRFFIRSRQEPYSTDWLQHVRGRITKNQHSSNYEIVDLKAISSSLPDHFSFEEHYTSTAMRGLEYGPGFQGVVKIAMSALSSERKEALGTIHLEELDGETLEPYRAHPSIVDSCFQILVSLAGRTEGRSTTLLPVQFETVRSYQKLPKSIFCHVLVCHESQRSVTADFKLMDMEGTVLFEVKGARCQKINFEAASSTPLLSEWWSLAPGSVQPKDLPELPHPEMIRTALSEDLMGIIQGNRREEFYRDIQPEIEKLIHAFVARVVESLTGKQEQFELDVIVAKNGILPERTPLLQFVVDSAVSSNLLSREGGVFRKNKTPETNVESIWRELYLKYPRYQAELLLILEKGNKLVEVLCDRDCRDKVEVLSDQLPDSSPFHLVYNQIARAVVERLVKLWPRYRPIRILEIGGGAGSLATWLLSVLPGLRTDYLLVDRSEAVIGRAERRLSGFRPVRFATLDVEADLVAQGVPENYFDLVVAANSIHTMQQFTAGIRNLHRVMTDDAQLLIVEADSNDVTEFFFLGEGPWIEGRRASRLLDADAWRKQLLAEGFSSAEVFSDSPSSVPKGPMQSVMLAQRSVMKRDHFDALEKKLPERKWLLVVEDDGSLAATFMNKALLNGLKLRGQEVAIEVLGSDFIAVGQFSEIWAKHKGIESVVYIASAGKKPMDTAHLLEVENLRSLHAIEVVKALEASRLEHSVDITFVTRGAFANSFGDGPLDPGQAPLWGLGRVIANEYPGLNCRLIDLHAAHVSEQTAEQLACELIDRDDETEVQLCAGYRFVNRERQVTLTEEARISSPLGHAPADSYRLDFSAQDGLDSLHLSSMERRAPSDGEVEIAVHAAGLNFRDVLWTMGVLPEEAVEEGFSGPTIGMECAGEIVRVGKGVHDCKVGDKVVAFAASCFASHVTTNSDSIHSIPVGMSFAEAATIPTAFLTAYYALHTLAQLRAGETVLIHGAAGGVGIAAIQVAKLMGAKIIGTAGSDRKRRMLDVLGVDHVLNSRSLEFSDDVMALTNGRGVDVILNSLAGEAITRSLRCLRPFGRFLEIGKRDLYANTHVGLRPFRKNLSYFAIDADTLLVEKRELAHSLFGEVMKHFEQGTLKPLPFELIPVSRASEAFRGMQQSRHIGKLVVSMELDLPQYLPVVQRGPAAKPGFTYIVTGGLGGFGLATAKWLVEQGATSLALLSRRGAATEEATQGIHDLEAMGISVQAFAVDITDRGALAKMLGVVRSTMTPIAGVVHSAAVIEDAPIMQISGTQLNRVLGPKIAGAWNLHQETLQDSIDMFVLYSSSSAVVGNPGQGAYVAGNLYLDALAQYRRSLGLPALAVGWGAIKDVGFLTRHGNVAEMLRTRTGMDATSAEDALRELAQLCSAGVNRMCVARFDLQRLGRILPGTLVPRFSAIITPEAASLLSAEETLASRLAKNPSGERRDVVAECVRTHVAKVLGAGSNQLDVNRPLAELGLDSLMAVELAVALERDTETPISVMQLLSAGSIRAIADLILKRVGAEKEVIAPGNTDKEQELVGQKI